MADTLLYALVKNGVVASTISIESGFWELIDGSERVDITGNTQGIEADWTYANGVFAAPAAPPAA